MRACRNAADNWMRFPSSPITNLRSGSMLMQASCGDKCRTVSQAASYIGPRSIRPWACASSSEPGLIQQGHAMRPTKNRSAVPVRLPTSLRKASAPLFIRLTGRQRHRGFALANISVADQKTSALGVDYPAFLVPLESCGDPLSSADHYATSAWVNKASIRIPCASLIPYESLS